MGCKLTLMVLHASITDCNRDSSMSCRNMKLHNAVAEASSVCIVLRRVSISSSDGGILWDSSRECWRSWSGDRLIM